MSAESSAVTTASTEAVLRAVAAREGVQPAELHPPLYDVIDPDALDTIFRGGTGRVSFEYQGYVVTVSHSGDVDLEPTKDGAADPPLFDGGYADASE